MQIVNNGGNELTISGNIKSIEDSAAIKDAVTALKEKGATSMHLMIQESFSMTSTVIGFLMKLVNIDKIRVTLVVGDARLYHLLDELSLQQVFNVRLIEK
jgi:hypothetical protein